MEKEEDRKTEKAEESEREDRSGEGREQNLRFVMLAWALVSYSLL